MSIRRLSLILMTVLVLPVTVAVSAEEIPAGSVQLPLPEYLALVEKAEALQREAREDTEEATADLAARTVRVIVGDEVAEIVTTFRVELAGTPTLPVTLPYPGMAEEVTVEPRRGASLDRDDGKVVLFAPQPGSYTVNVRGRDALSRAGGGGYRLELAASDAPVSSVEVELPAEHEWSCDGAVLVDEVQRDDALFVRLAPARGQEHVLEIRRRNAGREEERALVSSSVVTIVEVRSGATLARQDVVLYEVLRGVLGTFELEMPDGLELDRVTTDEGEAFPIVDGRRLTVERRRQLEGTGHLVVTYRPQPLDGEALAFAPLEPSSVPSARYLVAASVVAAEVRPQPAAQWRRIDLDDLPAALRREIAALRPNAVWSLAAGAGATRLVASLLPEAPSVDGVVWERDTMTLLTVDGSLVHRDRLVVEHMGTALEVELSPGTTLWSLRVDDLAVRPLERGGSVVVPLAFKSEGKTRIELVTVEERELAAGRSSLRLEPPRFTEPVVRHNWRLLLPEANRYRVASSELTRVDGIPRPARRSFVRELQRLPGRTLYADSDASGAGIIGSVVDGEGNAIPGATAFLEDSGMIQISNADGRIWFRGIEPRRYRLRIELDGFSTIELPLTVVANRTASFEVTMSPAIEETITVTSESPLLDAHRAREQWEDIEAGERAEAFGAALEDFESGLVGGVKPLAVEIPESGKLLVLAGALPPPRVGVELDVRAR